MICFLLYRTSHFSVEYTEAKSYGQAGAVEDDGREVARQQGPKGGPKLKVSVQ